MKEFPFFCVEVVKDRDYLGVVQAIITKPLSYVSPVFLFHMGVVIFVVCPASGELDGFFSFRKMSQEVMI